MRNIPILLLIFQTLTGFSYANEIDASLTELVENGKKAEVIVLLKSPNSSLEKKKLFAFKNPTSFVTSALNLNSLRASKVSSAGREGSIVMSVDADQLKRLRENNQVQLIAPNRAHWPTLLETGKLTGIEELNNFISSNGSSSKSGDGYTIAILDTGVDAKHPFLVGKIVQQACFSKNDPDRGIESLCAGGVTQAGGAVTDFSINAATNCPIDVYGCGHGIHVAGIAVGNTVADPRDQSRQISGIASGATVLAIQVFSKFTKDEDCMPHSAPCARALDSSILRALDYVQIQVLKDRLGIEGVPKLSAVNMSLGSGKKFAPCDDTNPLTRSINQLREIGVPTFIASGNDGFLQGVSSPACISSAITVGATNKANAIWSKTNRGQGDMVDVMATGVGVYSSTKTNGYKVDSGTSMATPSAAAVYTVLRSLHPDRTVSDLEASLKRSTKIVVDDASQSKFPMVSGLDAHKLLATGLPLAMSADATGVASGFSENGKDFIIAVRPEYASKQLMDIISNVVDDISKDTNSGKITTFELTPENLKFQTEKDINREVLLKSLRKHSPAISNVFSEPPLGHSPLQ